MVRKGKSMTESNAPWIESDGVSNLPNVCGIFELRCRNSNAIHYAYFDGEAFCGTCSEPERAMGLLGFHTGQFAPYQDKTPSCNDAWRDYQGLMSKLAKITGAEL